MDKNGKVSFRILNPLKCDESLHNTFCDANSAKATTATKLFRNDDMFDSLCEVVIPSFLEFNDYSFSCLSGGCSSGEEVYSLAVIAENYFKRKKYKCKLSFFGIDINKQCLQTGRQGVYSSINVPSKYLELTKSYALIQGRQLQFNERIKSMIKFGSFDLRRKPKNHTFNLVILNHVLQYYDNESQIKILSNLISVLRKGGFLYLEGVTPSITSEVNVENVGRFRNLYRCK